MLNLIAQKQTDLGEPLEGIGPFGLEGVPKELGGVYFNRFLSSVIGLMTIIASIWFIFLFIAGAYGIMSAGGDKTKAEEARKRITSGVTGLIIIVAALFIIKLIGWILGIDYIFDPGGFITDLTS